MRQSLLFPNQQKLGDFHLLSEIIDNFLMKNEDITFVEYDW